MPYTTEELIQKVDELFVHTYTTMPIVIDRAEGSWLYDLRGKKFLDMTSNYGAVNWGHTNREIFFAMTQQAMKVAVVSRKFPTVPLVEFAELLLKLSRMDRVLPQNSGTETFDAALKLARRWGYEKKRIPPDTAEHIVCYGNFHGRTEAAISASATEAHRRGFGPFLPGTVYVPFGDTAALEKAITPHTVAFFVEPVQGEGGVNVPYNGYLHDTNAICKKHNVLWVADEVQTGFGRTGAYFAFMHEYVDPDMIMVAKSLGGGYLAAAAVCVKEEVSSVIEPGDHGSTLAGNPLACAVAVASMNVLVQKNLHWAARGQGAYFINRLEELACRSPHAKEVRGKGLLIGMELNPSYPGGYERFAEKLLEKGVIVCTAQKNTVRFEPPLIITRDEIDFALEKTEEVLLEK